MSIGIPTVVQGLAMVASLATSGSSALGPALDRYGSRSHPVVDTLPAPAPAPAPAPKPPEVKPAEPATQAPSTAPQTKPQ